MEAICQQWHDKATDDDDESVGLRLGLLVILRNYNYSSTDLQALAHLSWWCCI